MQSLAKVQAGESCEIKWMFGNADVMNFGALWNQRRKPYPGPWTCAGWSDHRKWKGSAGTGR